LPDVVKGIETFEAEQQKRLIALCNSVFDFESEQIHRGNPTEDDKRLFAQALKTLKDMAEGSSFHRVLHDDAQTRPDVSGISIKGDKDVRRVILCSGKVYYDLLDAREKKGVDDVYILRLEQFYPWPLKSLSNELKRFKNAELVWCQEEPKNMGGWMFVDPWLELTLERMNVKAKRARYVGRPASASTAAGLMSRHVKELENFLTEAFA
jgi:2-oxoglutarate dehydrogenase E1 component